MKRFACNFFSVFFALLLCVGLLPTVAFAQPDEGDSDTQTTPHEAFSLEEGTYVEGEVLVLVDGQLPQSNSRSTQSETQDLFSFSEMVASTTEGDLLVGEEADEAVAQSNNENIVTMSELGNGASSDNTSSNSAATDTSSASDATDTPQIEQASTDARIVLVKDENKSTAQLLDEYAAMPRVLYVQPNYLYELTSLNGSYNDPYIDKQWFLEDSNIEGNPTGVGVENAWRDGNYGGDGYQASTTSQSGAPNTATEEAVVAVIDTGVRYDHPDLEDSMWTGGEKVAKELGWSIDINGDGVVDDGVAYGFDTYALTADDQTTAGDVDGFGPMDKNGHGTHVAGIVGAQLNNNEGGSGVAPGVKIMALRAAGDFFPSSGVFKAFQYVQTAKQMGVNVAAANNSWGGYSVDTLYTLIADDLYENGIVVLKASANSAKDHDVLPSDDALSDHMVLVNAIDSEGQLANFSDYGASSTDVAAPGVSIFSTVMDRDGSPDLDDESVVVKDGETPLKGTFIDMFGSSESFAFEVALQDVGPTADASAEVSVDSYGNFAWDMTLYPDDSSVISLTANKPISAEAVEQIKYLAFSAYAQSNIGGGFYVSLSAKGKEKDAAGNFERIELDSIGISEGSDGAYLTALTSLTDEQKEAIDWDNFTLYMSRTNSTVSDTWELTFNFNECAFVSQTTPYTSWDGTSMATPVASGVAAIIAQDLSDKGLSAEQQAAEVRARLIGGAIRDNDSLMGTSQSDGRLDVKKAQEDPNPVITDVQQSVKNPASATISGFFFGGSPSIELINADASDAKAVQLSVSEATSNEDGSTTYNVTLPEGMEEGSYYVKATNADNSNWGRMKLSLKTVPESSESGEEDPDNPSVDTDYFEAVASLSNDMTNLEGVPNGKKVGRTGYLTTPINVQSIGSKIYVMTRDFYLVGSDTSGYEDKGATYLLFVYDAETQTWSVDQNLASEDYVPCVSMAASGEHLYLVSSDGVQDYNTKDGSLDWIIGEKGTNTLALKYGFNSGQNEFLYSATSYVNGNELWITCVNKETLDGDVESYEFLNSVLVFDLANPSADAKVISSVKAGRAGSALFNVDGAMYLTPGGAFDSDFAFQEYTAMETLGKGATEWTSVGELPVALNGNQEYIAASAASDGKIIVSGLRANDPQDNGVVPDTYIYDTASNTWSIAEKQLAPHKITGAQGVIADDGYFYVLGTEVQDTGSLLTVKRCKVSDLIEPSENPDNPKDPEESDEPDNPKGPEESEDQNGPDTGEGVTPGGNSSSDSGESGALPQTSDPLRDYAKALVVLAFVGAMGAIVAGVQSRRMRVGTKRN